MIERLTPGVLSSPLECTLRYVRRQKANHTCEQSLCSFSINVTATDGGGLSNVTTVLITVLDENDNAPILSETAPVTLSLGEEAPIGTSVLNVTATDADAGTNAEVEFLLSGGSSTFAIDSSTGAVTSILGLDFEAQKQYNFTIVARNHLANPVLNDSVSVTVNVLDRNDNEPVFSPTNYSSTFAEDVVIGTEVGTLSATDADSTSNAEIRFSFVGGSCDAFEVDSVSGVVTTKINFDRESKDSHSCTATATDLGTPSLDASNVATVSITLTDVNDNDPVASPDFYEESVAEDLQQGVTIVTVLATDSDSGSNADLAFSITGGNIGSVFEVGSSSGVVTLASGASLDREDRDAYSLTITIADQAGAGRSTTATVNITVTDVNDNSPIFNQTLYESSVEENSPTGTVVAQVFATDGDIGSNAVISFSIKSTSVNDSAFEINSTSGEILVSGSLDFDTQPTYEIVIEAVDGHSTGARFSDAQVVISLLDLNDNPPIFDERLQTQFSLLESVEIGELVTTLVTSDADSSPFNNVTYHINHSEAAVRDAFEIDTISGKLSVAAPLDRESRDLYEVVIAATDGNAETLLNISITIEDVNDNDPIFAEANLNVSIVENEADTILLNELEATDIDAGINAALLFSIRSGSDGKFSINSATGELTVTTPLDRETKSLYSLIIVATDGGTPSREATINVSVAVLDVNDNDPIFAGVPTTLLLIEETQVGTAVLTLESVDLDDVGTPRSLTNFSLASETQLFSLSPEGILTVAARIDREVQSQINLTLIVSNTDGLRSSRQNLTVVLSDINDNTPQFVHGDLTSDILEFPATNSSTVIAVVEALDADVSSQVSYFVRSSPSNIVFTMTGDRLHAVSLLDFEVVGSGPHTVVVEATDGTLNSTINVIVTLGDVNDNSPQAVANPSFVQILENTTVGTVLFEIVASDLDSGSNSELIFSLISETTGKFAVNETTGIVVSRASFNREDVASFVVNVLVSDRGTPSLDTTVSVPVLVVDIDDNAPVFAVSGGLAISIFENASVGTTLNVNATASDDDEGSNSDIFYSLVSGHIIGNLKFFDINNETGTIVISSALDRESVASFSIVLRAGHPRTLSSFSLNQLNVTVLDVNDNAPIFSPVRVEVDLTEERPPLSPIDIFVATDADESPSLSYSLTGGSGLFEIHNTSGLLSTVVRLDRDEAHQFENDQFSLNITATDESGNKGSMEVIIT